MQVFHGHEAAKVLPQGGAVALGNFDGVHVGHQELVRRAVAFGAQQQAPSVVFTFEPHPSRVLAPASARPLIIPLDLRLRILERLGPTAVLLEPFTLEFSRTPARQFVQEVLHHALRVKKVVVGFNFNFGFQRTGNPALLVEMGKELGFGVDVVDAVRVDGEPCSSSLVRKLVLEGNVARVQAMLGRPFSVRGTVVQGHQRGRLLGFPTANVQSPVEMLPAQGVYAARVSMDDAPLSQALPAVVNIGVAPTFGGGPVTVEAHLLDFQGDLYGRTVEVHFLDRLRAEKRFAGVDALKAQIHQDAQDARRILA